MILVADTSALVRRYDLTEPGSTRVVQLCRPASDNEVALLSITSVELSSALQRKLREGRINRPQRDRMWRLFLAHRRVHYREIAVDATILRRAERLLGRHPLRAAEPLDREPEHVPRRGATTNRSTRRRAGGTTGPAARA